MVEDRRTIVEMGVRAALKLAADTPWGELTLAEIAEEAGISLEQFHGRANKDTIADAVERYFDKAMSEGSFDEEEAPRTRLFDVIMMRFEAMEDYRPGLVSLMKWRPSQPARLLNLIAARQASADWALVCSGLDSSEGLPKPIKATGIAWAIAQAERAWRKDESADLPRTMAALDGELRKMEERASWITGRRRKKKPAEAEAAESEPAAPEQAE